MILAHALTRPDLLGVSVGLALISFLNLIGVFVPEARWQWGRGPNGVRMSHSGQIFCLVVFSVACVGCLIGAFR